ncbi:MAG TPA: LuxR C-terminal-related transcriptional regulator [Jatrophihabitantaceae bacterium]|nr:LuxR C-terminal-related transcriptional regulator [Jatrophihabitantaceae bacterium]
MRGGSADVDAGEVGSFVPTSVRRRVVQRLKRLGADELALARMCAVVGEGIDLESAAQLAGLAERGAVGVANRLVEAQIFVAVEPLSFAHPIVRSAVYDDLSPTDAAAAHAAVARMLHDRGESAERVAHHLLAADRIGESWAVDALHQGARAASRMGAPATAVRMLRRALSLCEPTARTADMLVTLGLAEAAAGEPTSLSHFTDAVAIADRPDRTRALYALGETLYRYGRHGEAEVAFRRGMAEAEGNALDLPFEGAYMCTAYYDAARHPEIVPELRRILTSSDGAGDSAALALAALHGSFAVPPAAPAVAAARRALADSTRTAKGIATNIAMCALWLCGHASEAIDAADRVLAQAGEYGNALAFAETSMMRALFARAVGRVADAVADAQASIDGVARGWQGTGAAPHSVLALCLIDRGSLAEAEEALDRAAALMRSELGLVNAWYFEARGRLALLRGNPELALTQLLAVRDALAPYGIVNPVMAPWRSLAALAAHGRGDDAHAREFIDEELAQAEAFGLPVAIAVALRIKAVIPATGPDQLKLLERSAALLAGGDDAWLEQARTQLALGVAYRRAGRRVDSREPLRRALDLAHRCGASALETEAREELLASGARPRSPVMTGLDALTPSERRIAQLAADGRSNSEIAGVLFLTKNTVAWHIKNIYRKLDVDSRPALQERLAGEHSGS